LSTAARLAAFALALGAIFAVAAAVGAAVGPFERSVGVHDAMDEPVPHGDEEPVPHDDEEPDAPEPGHGAHDADADGLAAAAGGLSLDPASAARVAGRPAPFAFRILDSAGAPVRDFDEVHERRMHLIIVRRDLTGFQHLHPDQRADGSWELPLRLAAPGSYRFFADFSTGGEGAVLAGDLHVPGGFEPVALPAPAPQAAAGPYRVSLGPVHAQAGERVRLAFAVRRDGRPAELAPYLGAGGHLVILREGDIAYLHTHPEEHGAAAPGTVSFETAFPSAGRYRAFLQFRAGGSVRTAAFTIEVGHR
jgi:hypothetical protein